MNFEEKYDVVMNQIDNLLKHDNTHNALKKYIEGYKIEKMIQDREEKKMEESFQQYGTIDKSILRQRNQIVGLSEIKEHEKYYAKAKYEKLAQREINRMKERERCNEYNNRIGKEMKMNRKRLENYEQKKNENKEMEINVVYSNNIKKKEFGDFVNKINIERIQRKRIPSPQQRQTVVKPAQNQKQKHYQTKEDGSRNKVSNSQQNQKKRVIHFAKHSNKEEDCSKEKRVIATSVETRVSNEKPKAIQKDYIKEGLKFAKKNKGNKFSLLSESKKFINQDDFANNIDTLKFKAKKYEELAKKQEQLIKINGGPRNNLQASEKASNYLFDSIVAKISLLKQMSSEQ